MKKKLIVIVIAVVLVAAVVGTCFALYKIPAQQKVININASADVCNLTLNSSASLDFANISPNNRTKTADVTLDVDDSDLVDGVHGTFKVAVSGNLANYITVTVNSIASIGAATPGAVNADAITNAGADIALSDVPQYFRITLYLNDSGVTNFATIAEKTGTVTVSWTVDESSVFSYDATAYYIVGTINGSTHWQPSSESIVAGTGNEGNYAIATNVSLKSGDSIKAVLAYRSDNPTWYGGKTNNTEGGNDGVAGVYVASDNANVDITADGNYDIYVGKDGRIWVAAHS